MSSVSFPAEMACFAYNYTPGFNLYSDLRLDCPLGFYCPNVTSKNYFSSPRQCPASSECGVKRLTGFNCAPQGPYEPVVCEQGFYCPNHYTKTICPAGFYCPIGSYQPTPCAGLAVRCPEGSAKYRVFDSAIILFVLDAFLVFLYFLIRHFRVRRTARKDTARVARLEAAKKEDLENPNKNVEKTSNLLEYFKKGLNGREVRMDFKFENMGLKLPNNGKTVLKGVSGSIRSSRMTAIMGPSGAGKTTFMNVLCGKVQRTSGILEVSGKEAEIHQFKKMIGYVPQEDVMIRTLTVREILMHAARIRLPRTWSDPEKKEYVDALIETLNLAHVQDVNIGDEHTRGVSGGQRKRVNIGIELCAIPTCIFLDEPTSGLDSTAALEVCDNLRQIAALGLTIVSVIHQPRIEIFEKFDDVFLIAPGGQTAYLGPASECQAYFESLGYYFNPRVNPADILMDILSGKGVNEKNKYTSDELVRLWALKRSKDSAAAVKEAEANKEAKKLSDDEDKAKSTAFHEIVPSIIKERGAKFHTQFFYCHQRSLIQQYAEVWTFLLELAIAIFAGAVIGLCMVSQPYIYRGLFIQPLTLLSPSSLEWLAPLVSFLLGMIVTLSAAPPGVAVFSEERATFFREASSGHDRLAYFLAKIVTSFYRLAIAAMHFSVPLHLITAPTISFSSLYALVFCLFAGIYGVAHSVSMVFPRERAGLFAVLACMVQTAASGFGISQAQAEKKYYIGWLFNMTFFRWVTEVLWNESVTPFGHIYMIDASSAYWGFILGRIWWDLLYAFLIGLGWRVIAFILLITVDKDKQR